MDSIFDTPEFSRLLLWGTVVSDLLIATVFIAIPAALITLSRKHKKDKYNHVLLKTAFVIAAFGVLQLIYLWNIWQANILLEVIVKTATGLIALYFSYLFWRSIPKLLRLPSSSELRRLNKNLSESETRYRKLFETAKEGVFVTNMEGDFSLVNQAMADMLGYSQEKILTGTLFDFLPEDSHQAVRDIIALAPEGRKGGKETLFRHADGSAVYSQVACTYIVDNNNNESLLFVVTDISEKIGLMKNLESLNQNLEGMVDERTKELRVANNRLHEEIDQKQCALHKEKLSKSRLDAVFNLSPNGIIITNRLGIITDVNSAAETMFGYRRSELIAKHVNILTPQEFSEDHVKYIKDADISITSKKLGFGRKLTAVRRYDISFPVDVSLTKISHSENDYYMAVIRDLTEIDAVENELRSVNDRLMNTIYSLKQQSRETSLLNEYTEMLQTCNHYHEYPDIVNSYCASILGSKTSEIFMLKDNEKLESMDPGSNNLLTVHDCWALKSNKPYPINERQKNIPCQHSETGVDTVCLPLSAKGRLLGLITLHYMPSDLQEGYSIFEDDTTLHAFSVRTSICLANLKLLKEKEMQSFKDELTGLYNRRFMNETLMQELPRAKREGMPVTVMMIDVDYFKQFNDNYGHDLGDVVLVQVGRSIEQCMRESDLVCRFGGEEFLVIMFNATEEDGRVKANNIHASIQTIKSLPLPITVSIGVAEREQHDSAEDLIRHADMALYDAKENGRNQTQCYTIQQVKQAKNIGGGNRPTAN